MNKKIYSLLIVLDKTERKRFLKQYLATGIKNERLYQFTKYLFDFLPDGKKANQTPDPKKLHTLVAKANKPFNLPSRQVNEYNNYLIDDLLDYIIQLRNQDKDFLIEKEIQRLAALRSYPTLLNFFLQRAKKIEKDIIATGYQDIRYYQQLTDLYQTIYEHPLYNNIKENNGILHRLIDSQNKLFFAKTLKYRCAELTTSEIIGFEGQALERYISTEELGDITLLPQISSYYYQKLLHLIIAGKNLYLAKDFLADLRENIDQLRRKEADDISSLLLNYCNNFASAIDGPTFKKLSAEIIILRVDSKVLNIKNQPIKINTFINVVVCGLQVGRIAWVKDFVKKIEEQLPSTNRYMVLQIAQARILLAEQQYPKAYDTLINLLEKENRNKNYSLGLLSRWTLTKCCYHLRSTDSENSYHLERHIHAFEQWLNVRLLEGDFKADVVEGYKNAMSMLRKLDKMDFTSEHKKKELIAKINEIERLAGRDWFLEQLE